jgi:hypothetical protein
VDDTVNETLADACAEFMRCWSMYQQSQNSVRRLSLMSARGRLVRTVGRIRAQPLAHFQTAELPRIHPIPETTSDEKTISERTDT